MSDALNIFIGYDADEIVADHVPCQSIIESRCNPFKITPLNLRNLGRIFSRQFGAKSIQRPKDKKLIGSHPLEWILLIAK